MAQGSQKRAAEMKLASNQHIGHRLQEARKHLGLSQRFFAEQVGISRVRLANMESGRTSVPCGLALRICRQFVLGEDWLATGFGGMRDYLDLISDPAFLELDPSDPFCEVFSSHLSGAALRRRGVGVGVPLSVVDQVDAIVGSNRDDVQQLRNLLFYALSKVDGHEAALASDPGHRRLHADFYRTLVLMCRRFIVNGMGGSDVWRMLKGIRTRQRKTAEDEAREMADRMEASLRADAGIRGDGGSAAHVSTPRMRRRIRQARVDSSQ